MWFQLNCLIHQRIHIKILQYQTTVDTKYKSKPNLKISNLINTQISHQPQLTMTSMILRKAYKSGMFMDNDFNKNGTSNFPHSSHN